MRNESASLPSCKDSKYSESRYNVLRRLSSHTFSNPSRLLSQISAAGLVLASAGLGAVYAFTVGIQHGAILAALFILFAAALELAKPLAVASTLSAFGSWQPVRGLALTLLATLAIAYSLTAELTLMAGARGDAVAQREAAIEVKTASAIEARRAGDRYERAKLEFEALGPTRPSAEVRAEIEGLLLTPGADGCAEVNGPVTKRICPAVVRLRIEFAKASHRESLAAILSEPPPGRPKASNDSPAPNSADPGATALSVYLAALGFTVSVPILSEYLALIPVLALEIGSALALVLVQAVGNGPRQPIPAQPRVANTSGNGSRPVVQVVQADEMDPCESTHDTREQVAKAIVNQLQKAGGSASSSERGLAKLIGASRPTVRRALQGLVFGGLVALEASRNGTMMRLIA